jgi:hypothetical protein
MAIRHYQHGLPFHVDALVLLPDQIHPIWSLPPGDCDYSKRWGIVKKYFTQHWLALGGVEQPVTETKQQYHRRGVWQRRLLRQAQHRLGSMRCATNGIIKTISITCISIRLNTAWLIKYPTDLIRRFIIGSSREFILTIGIVGGKLTTSCLNHIVNKRRVRITCLIGFCNQIDFKMLRGVYPTKKMWGIYPPQTSYSCKDCHYFMLRSIAIMKLRPVW